MEPNVYTKVDARPVKRFFVEMLTRDIELEDAILDLLDNCLDGVLRSRAANEESETPYQGYWAKIIIKDDTFQIDDNCGGIPWSAHDRAFRMGRPANDDGTTTPLSIGVYGIGLKRAIFKMGRDALIVTQSGEDNYEVMITDDWIKDEGNWYLEVKAANTKMEHDGTSILVQELHPDVSEVFAAEKFQGDLSKKIASHFAVILSKGFEVTVNDVPVMPNPIIVRFATEASDVGEVRPYMFRSNFNDVDVFVAIGLREPIPDVERTIDEHGGVQFSSDYAGWTVICNDRVVLYCDRSELTGWGLFDLPRYHTQFIAISGTVEFRGDPRKLPTTTTKRGLNFSSLLYQQVLERMRDGLRLFIDFTNHWKTNADQAKNLVAPVPALSYYKVKAASQALEFNRTRKGLEGEQYVPKLPRPSNENPDVRLSYVRPKKDAMSLAEKLLPNFDDLKEKEVPRAVGAASFDYAYKQLLGK